MATAIKKRDFTTIWKPHILALYESGDYSDLTIKCQDRVFNVHKAVICPQSPVIAAAESETNVLEVNDYDVEVVEVFILFMYGKRSGLLADNVEQLQPRTAAEATPAKDTTDTTTSISFQSSLATGTVATTATTTTATGKHHKPCRYSLLNEEQMLSTLQCLVQINCIADYYDVRGLRFCTRDEIGRLMQAHTGTSKLLAAANIVSSSTGDTRLHHLFIKHMVLHMKGLMEYTDTEEFQNIIALDCFVPKLMEYTQARFEAAVEELKLLRHFADDMTVTFRLPFYKDYLYKEVAEKVAEMEKRRKEMTGKIDI
ncbi:hypothetical protein Sste5344_002504 [Sporothrix stenoceras]